MRSAPNKKPRRGRGSDSGCARRLAADLASGLPDIYVAMREFYPLMPDKVGLLGFDNTEWAGVASPSVSIVVQPAYEEGRSAAQMLIDLIDEKDNIDNHQVLSCSTQWGTTTL